MSKFLLKALFISPAVLVATFFASGNAIAASTEAVSNTETLTLENVTETEMPLAQVPANPNTSNDVLEQINRYSNEGQENNLNQVNSVTQFRDVSPRDWAYEALRGLVERYGCIAGYPNGTYRGNRALTRYEFAAGLYSCLTQIERLIAASTADFITRDDLATLERLIQEFEAELATLGTRVDNLEARLGFLEENQFSTTTKLSGEVIFALTDVFGADNYANNTVFGDRVRLTLSSTFTGQDTLVTRLATGNLSNYNVATDPVALGGDSGNANPSTFQTFNLAPSNSNDVFVDWLAYYFPLGGSQLYVAGTGGIHSDYVPTLNPYFEDYDGGNGALSTFAQENPIYRIGGGAGAAVTLGVGPLQRLLGNTSLTVGYLAENPSDPDPANRGGIFNSDDDFFDVDFAALAQLNFNLGDRVGVGLTYVRGSHGPGDDIFDLGGAPTISPANNGVVGTFAANDPLSVLPGNPTGTIVTDNYGAELAFRLSDRISISGFATYTDVNMFGFGDADIWTYGGGIAFPDFGKEGNVLGIFGGVQPYVSSIEDNAGNDLLPGDDELPYHVELFYKYQLTDNISITPGVIWLANPNGDEFGDTDDTYIGTLRTTFTF